MKKNKIDSLKSQVVPIEIPYSKKTEEDWTPIKQMFGKTATMEALWIHLSVLNADCWSHPPHKHEQAETLLLVHGEADLVVPDAPDGKVRRRVFPGDLSYYPANFTHTIEKTGDSPANYIIFKWHNDVKRKGENLKFGEYKVYDKKPAQEGDGFQSKVIFQGQTEYLKNFSCHTAVMEPGAGYEPRADDYDVVIIVLEGEVETLGQRVMPYGVIFYAAGEPHGMRNPGETPVRYVVFEFHEWPKTATAKLFWPLIKFWSRVKNPEKWKRTVRRVFGKV